MSVDTYTMTPETFAALRAQADDITLQDREVGLMFQAILLHLGHLYGLDPAKEDARLAALLLVEDRKEEDDRLQASADALAKVRATEDATANLTPEQVATRTAARTQEDEQIKADAVSLQEYRDAEDARLQAAQDEAQNQAAAAQQPVAEPVPVTDVPPAPDQAASDAPINVAQAPAVQEGEL